MTCCAAAIDRSIVARTSRGQRGHRGAAAQPARIHGREHAADDRDAEGAAEFAGGVVDGRADAGLVGGQRAHDRLGGRRGGQPEAAAEQHHLHGDLGCRAWRRRRSTPTPARPRRWPGRRRRRRWCRSVRRCAARRCWRRAIEIGDRQQPHAGLECAVALDELEVLGDDEDEAEQGQEAGGHGEAAAGEPPVREHRHVEHRMRCCAAPTARTRRARRRRRRSPMAVRALPHPQLGASMTV